MEKSRGPKRFVVQFVIVVMTMAALTTLYFFPPAEHSFYPRCLFRSLTGFDCLGCGSLRAMHELLHGNFSQAFQLNRLLVFSLPLLGILGLRRMLRAWIDKPISHTKSNYV